MRDVDETFASAGQPDPSRADLVASLYDLHQRELYTFALRTRRNPDTAADVVHEAFVQLIGEIEADRMPRNVRAWLHRAVASRVAAGEGPATPKEHSADDPAGGDQPAGSTLVDNVDQPDPIDIALGELDEDGRMALLLAANGFNGMEVAETIGRSATATRTLLTRTRIQLHDRLLSSDLQA